MLTTADTSQPMTHAAMCAATDSAAARVIESVADGLSLKAALRLHSMAPATFQLSLSRHRVNAVSYARAREIRADMLADEIVEIADTDEDSNRARNRINARQWLASKHHAKVYGDRIDLNVSQTLSITEVLAEARARVLRPMCDQAPTIDAQVVEQPTLCESGPSDRVSGDALDPVESGPSEPPGPWPDIFS